MAALCCRKFGKCYADGFNQKQLHANNCLQHGGLHMLKGTLLEFTDSTEKAKLHSHNQSYLNRKLVCVKSTQKHRAILSFGL